jgi:hypothetical protein
MLRLTRVEICGPHSLRVAFDDGVRLQVDLRDELHGEVFEPLRDPEVFARAYLNPETGTVEWPNGADLAPTFLREKGTPA